MRKVFGEFPGGRVGVALLLLRLVMGIAFLQHGWTKIQHPTSWMGPDSSTPAFLQLLAAVSEFGGGLALVLGLLTPLASLGIFFTMCFAVRSHLDKGGSWVGGQGSYELPLLYLVLAIAFMMVGAGKYSLDASLFGRRRA